MDKIFVYNTADLLLRFRDMTSAEGLAALGRQPKQRSRVPALVYLVRTETGDVLVDTGTDANPYATGLLDRRRYKPVISLDWLPRVRELPLTVCFTHAHFDHTGNLSRLNVRRVFVHDVEWESAPRSVRREVPPSAEVRRFLREDFQPGNYPFRSYDVSGKKTFHALDTEGHSGGHTAYLAEMNGYRYLFAGDLCEGYDGLYYPPAHTAEMPAKYLRTLGTLVDWLKNDPKLVLLPSHEPALAALAALAATQGELDTAWVLKVQKERLAKLFRKK